MALIKYADKHTLRRGYLELSSRDSPGVVTKPRQAGTGSGWLYCTRSQDIENKKVQEMALPAFRLGPPTLFNTVKIIPLRHCLGLISEAGNAVHRGKILLGPAGAWTHLSSSFHREERFPSGGPPLRPLPSASSPLLVMPGAMGSSCGRSCLLGNGPTGT